MLTVGGPIINVKFLKCLNKKYQKPNNLHFRKLMVILGFLFWLDHYSLYLKTNIQIKQIYHYSFPK